MAENQVMLKGTGEGLLISLGDGEWQALLTELESRLKDTAAFFRGAEVILDPGTRLLTAEMLKAAMAILKEHDIELHAVVSANEDTISTAQGLGLRAQPPRPRPHRRGAKAEVKRPVLSEGILLRGTVRSGQVVQHPGHVVIIGDVNPGGQVIAGGDVIVWGRVRGVVQAGAIGDDEAVVCALNLAPAQLRIGNYIARAPEEQDQHKARPEVAYVKDGTIVVDSWESM